MWGDGDLFVKPLTGSIKDERGFEGGIKKGEWRTSADKGVPCGVGSSALLLPRSVDVNQGEVLHDLLHFLEPEQGGEAALTCQGRGETGGKRNAEVRRATETAASQHSLS